jgi:hypothetical protein
MPDRITVWVVQYRLKAIAREMGEVMFWTASSQTLNSNRDFLTPD